MNRFEKGSRGLGLAGRLALPAIIFGIVFGGFFWGIHSISKTSLSEEKKNLETAVLKDATQCYALEGSYPQSLSYLKEHYGLTYDSSRLFVSYHAYGSNMLPVINVIALK